MKPSSKKALEALKKRHKTKRSATSSKSLKCKSKQRYINGNDSGSYSLSSDILRERKIFNSVKERQKNKKILLNTENNYFSGKKVKDHCIYTDDYEYPAEIVHANSKNQNGALMLSQLCTTSPSVSELSEEEFPSFLRNMDEMLFSEESSSLSNDDISCEQNDATRRKRKKHEIDLLDGPSDDMYERKIYFHSALHKNLVFAVVQHPVEVVLHGVALIRVLSGSVSVLGHFLNSHHSFLPVFSSEKFDCITLKTEHPECILEPVTLEEHVAYVLQEVDCLEIHPLIVRVFDRQSVLIVMKRHFFCRDVDYASHFLKKPFYPRKQEFSISEEHFENFQFQISLLSEEKRYILDEDIVNTADKIVHNIGESKFSHVSAPRILVCGNKNSGKSSLVRYLMNTALNVCDTIYHLEADPGQTEFTPPGCVSLTHIQKPLFGPPFTHQKTPERMHFVGGVDIADDPDLYIDCVCRLAEYYKNNCSEHPLYINTMGWTVGIGLSLLIDIIRMFEPTHVILLKTIKKVTSLDLSPQHVYYTAKGWRSYGLSSDSDVSYELITLSSPAEQYESSVKSLPSYRRRDLAIMAYLGRLQNAYQDLQFVGRFNPYCVPWSALALHVCNEPITPHHILYAFNGTLVALCQVDPSQILESDDPSLPKLIVGTPKNTCLGFGILRSIDAVKKLFYIITPEPLCRVKNANALLRGNVNVPPEIVLDQVCDKSIPYVEAIEGKVNRLSRFIRNKSWSLKIKKNSGQQQRFSTRF